MKIAFNCVYSRLAFLRALSWRKSGCKFTVCVSRAAGNSISPHFDVNVPMPAGTKLPDGGA